ncbi:MAG: deoxyribonuclease IV [Planctomycetota bacterium]|nr:MAG: deoxyribonuclease IV [Planctomycetota bacterium]
MQRRFGAQTSIADGLYRAFERGINIGCDCLQVFVKNQRQWKADPISEQDIRAWRQAESQSGIGPVFAHDAYLINLASPDKTIWNKSIEAFVDELYRCEQLNIGWLVTHPGTHGGKGEDWGIRRMADALDIIHSRTERLKVKTVLETTAGQGNSIGHRFQHLAEIIQRTRNRDRLAVCFDTCHVFAAGYDLTSEKAYRATMTEFDKILGLSNLVCFHLNDSKKPFASRVDRHQHIGQGQMGYESFRLLVNDPRFFGMPMIIETPKGIDDKGQDLDRINLAALRKLIQNEGAE